MQKWVSLDWLKANNCHVYQYGPMPGGGEGVREVSLDALPAIIESLDDFQTDAESAKSSGELTTEGFDWARLERVIYKAVLAAKIKGSE